MAPHTDILDERDSIRTPFAASLGLHGSLVAAALISGYLSGRGRVSWGDPNAFGGGSVGINVVKQIPLPSRGGEVSRVANDTESAVPAPPAERSKPVRAARQAAKDAIAIKGRPEPAPRKRFSKGGSFLKEEAPNQVYSASGRALASPMIGQTGSGGVGVGTGTPFGNRFGAYVDLLRTRVAEKWRTNDVDARIQTAPPVIVTFTIRRNGSTANVRVVQRSGNTLLDDSAQRAIYDASPFPPLPAGYERDDATIEFWFQLKR
jgi:protein TonB